MAQQLTRLINTLEDAPEAGRANARFLLTGHSGCGKTTELYRLKDALIEAGFAVVYFDAGFEFDLQKQNVDWWSVLLEMIWQVDEQLRQPPFDIHIPAAKLDDAVEFGARGDQEDRTARYGGLAEHRISD